MTVVQWFAKTQVAKLLKREDITGYGETIMEWIQELLRTALLAESKVNDRLRRVRVALVD